MNVLKTLNHPKIIKLYDAYKEDTHYILIVEHCSGGDLFDYVAEQDIMTEQTVSRLIKQILEGLALCHSTKKANAMPLVHCDICPANILIHQPVPGGQIPNLKIVDFGLATWKTSDTIKDKGVQSYFMAPEVVKHEFDAK